MGDRANIIVKQEGGDPPVVIYSHWGGTRLHRDGVIEEALQAAHGRAGDPHYFTALLVAFLSEQGLVSGIGTSLDDNEYPIMVVDSHTGEREPDMNEHGAREYLGRFRVTTDE